MKIIRNFIIYPFFTIAYAFFFSLGTTCMLAFLSSFFGNAFFGTLSSFLKDAIFCFVFGFFALAALIFLFFINIKYAKRLNYTKPKWIVQFICVFILYVPMMNCWLYVFDYLESTFWEIILR